MNHRFDDLQVTYSDAVFTYWLKRDVAQAAPAAPRGGSRAIRGYAGGMDRTVRPRVVLATCCMSLFLVTMDITIVNLALPAMSRDLHTSMSGMQWAIDSYTVVLASLLIVAGATADRFGRRRLFQIGLCSFCVGSLLCGLAPSIELLVAFRVLQAIGGSMMNPVAMSIIVNVFPEPQARARAIGAWSSVVGLSMAVGPLLGGFLVDTVGWRAVFWINVPVALAALALTRRFVPESRAPRPRRPDLVGLALIVVGLAALTSCLIEGHALDWRSPTILGGLALSALAFAGLLAYERRRVDPLLELRFFRSLPFSTATLLAVLSFTMFNGGLFLSSLYLQLTRGLSSVRAGLCLLPIAGGLIVCSRLAGRLVASGRARWSLIGAGVALGGAALLLVRVQVATPLALVVGTFALMGIGSGLINAPITTAAVSGMPPSQAGVAAAIASTSRQVGATLGVAVAGMLTNTPATSPGFAVATRPFWWFVAAGGVGIVALGVLATCERARQSALAIRELFD
jgi:EmrB/QacA subfamily drug resistance transporter